MAGPKSETRFAIDAVTALRLVREHPGIGTRRSLVGPGLLRSHVLSMLYRETCEGRLEEKTAREQLEGVAALKMRLLGDRASRAVAWKIAQQLDWDDTELVEYIAVATLQADVLVAGDERIAAAATGLIPIGTYDDLTS